jgi:hypothetical protein
MASFEDFASFLDRSETYPFTTCTKPCSSVVARVVLDHLNNSAS